MSVIVVDGDSVAWVPKADGTWWMWPELLAKERGMELVNLATHEATSRDCMLRMWKAAAAKPAWYVLCVGQWAQNHEPVDEFEINMRRIMEHMRLSGIGVVLVNYPSSVISAPHRKIVEDISIIYQTGYLDLKTAWTENPSVNYFEKGDTVPCHFNATGARMVVDIFNKRSLCR